MKIKRNEFESAIDQLDHQLHGSTKTYVDALLRELGIEIVPDPEPELPPRPWRLKDGGNHPGFVMIVDRDGNTVFGAQVVGWREPQFAALEALVSAYNAAGERTRLVISELGNGRWLCCDAKHRLAGHSAASKALAIGFFVADHASDLGLEIVES